MNLKKIYYKIEMFNYGIFVTLFFDFVKKKSHQICFPLTRMMPKLDFGKKTWCLYILLCTWCKSVATLATQESGIATIFLVCANQFVVIIFLQRKKAITFCETKC